MKAIVLVLILSAVLSVPTTFGGEDVFAREYEYGFVQGVNYAKKKNYHGYKSMAKYYHQSQLMPGMTLYFQGREAGLIDGWTTEYEVKPKYKQRIPHER